MKSVLILLAVTLALAACSGSGGRTPDGLAPAKSGAEAARQRAKVHTDLGMAYLESGQLTTALDEARQALASDSSFSMAYNLLGLAHMQMKEPALAEEYFERGLRLAPGDSDISNNFGWLLCQGGREARAFEYFEQAAKNPLYRTPARPLIGAGICANRLKDFKRAEGYLTQALRFDPGSVDASYHLAETMFQQQRFAEARQRLDGVHKRADPTAASAWLALRLERKAGDREGEARWIAQLRRKFADSPEYRKLTQGTFE